MKLGVLLCATAAAVAVAAAPSAADNPADWDSSVAAMQAVDPTIAVPPYNPAQVLAVGGGKLSPFGGGAFAVGATQTPAGTQGAMTVVGSVPGVTLHAQVTCIAAAALPDGRAIAKVIGHVTNPDLDPSLQMEFFMTDSGEPSGSGDMWGSDFTTAPLPCVPLGADTPIVEGNITIHVP
jgi:hypothetical protein